MTTANKAQYKQNLKRLKRALGGKFTVSKTEQAAYVVGDGHIKIDGSYYDAATSGIAGTTTKMVNIGRPAAAIYAPANGAGSAIISTGGSGTTTVVTGGTGGAPTNASYLVVAPDPYLTNERSLLVSTALTMTDTGPNNALTIGMALPQQISATSTNVATLGHSHQVVASSAPGANEALLKSDSDGALTLVNITASNRLRSPLLDTATGGLTLSPADGTATLNGSLTARGSGQTSLSVMTAADSAISTIGLFRARNNIDSPVAVLSGDSLGLITFGGYHSGGAYSTVSAHINAFATEDHTGSARGGALAIFTADTGSPSPVERQRWHGSGNVTVGTSTDSGYKFDVSGTMRATTSISTPILTTASGDLTIAPADDIMLDPTSNLVKATSGVSLQSDNYTSQISGWRVTHDGQADFRYLYVDEMHAKSFIADLEQALAGGQIIAKSVTILYSTFTAPAPEGTALLVVRDLPSATGMACFVNGDYIRIRTFSRSGGGLTIADCWGTVVLDTSYGASGFDSATKTQRYTFTRSASPNAGAMTTGSTVDADAIILDYGTSGNGYYEVNAIDGLYGANSPYSQIVTWSGHPRSQTVRARLGNLYGIWSVSGEYGLYAGSGVTDDDSYLRISSDTVRLNNVPLQLYDGGTQTVNFSSTGDDIWIGQGSDAKILSWDGSALSLRSNDTDVITLDTSGNSYFAGVMTIGASGEIRQGTGTLGSNYTGLRIWRDSSVGRIAGYNNNVAQWYANTDGKLYAGGGTFMADADGIHLGNESYAKGFQLYRSSTFSNSQKAGGLWALSDLGNNVYLYAGRSTGLGDAANANGFLSLTAYGSDGSSVGISIDGSASYTTISELLLTDDLRPSVTDTYDLGSSSYYYDHAYIRTLHTDTVVGTPSFSHNHAATDINSGTLDLARIPTNLTGKNADLLDGYNASDFALTGHTHAYVPTSRTVTAGAGLTGGGALSADITIALATPGTLTATSTNSASSHTHAITASAAPGAAESLLKSTSGGGLTLVSATATTNVITPQVATASGTLTLAPANSAVDVVGSANIYGNLTASTDSYTSFNMYAAGTAAFPLMALGRSRGTGASRTALQSGDQIAAIRFQGYHSGGAFHLNAAIDAYATQNYTGTAGGASLVFSTTPNNSATVTEAMRLHNSGNLSIGSASDGGYKLDVTGTMRASTSVTVPLVTTTSGDLTLAAADDLMLDPTSNLVKITSGVSLQTDNYVSQTTGWRATYSGEADYRYLYVDEMHAKSFIADLEQALAGGQIIAKSVTILYSAFTAPVAGGTALLVVRDLPSATGMACFVNNDYVRIRNFSRSGGSLTIADCWGTVVLDTSYGTSGFDSTTKTQRYTFTRSANPNAGAMTSGTVVAADAIILDYGTSGNGFYEVNAIDGAYGANSPYSQIVTWASHPRTQTVRARLGNLYGIWSVANEYGLFAGGGVTDADSYLRISNNTVRLNNVPLQLFHSGTQTVDIGSTNGSVKLGTNISSPSTTSFDFNGATGALVIKGDLTAASGDLTANAYGLNIAAFNGSASSWTDAGKGLKFTTNPTTPTTSTITGRISGTRRTDISPNYNMLQIESRGGSAYGAPDAFIDMVASDADSAAGIASIRLSVSTTAANEVVITSQDPSGASSYIGLYGIARTFTVRPYATNTHDLGSSSYYYNNAYVRNLHTDTIVGTPSYSHSHAATDITSGTLALARIPATLTGKDADTLDGYHASSFALASGSITSIVAGGGISVSGTTTVTVSHSDTSAQTSVDNSAGTVIQDVTLDTYGHVTALASANLDSRYAQALTAGAGVTITGTLAGYTIAHTDTSTQANVSNTGVNFIQSMTFDTNGHVTGVTSSSISSALDAIYVNVTGDTMTGPLVMNNTTIGDLAGLWSISAGGVLSMAPNTDVNHTLGRAIVGYGAAADSATFAHYDHHTSTNFGFAQYANGATQVNAVTGQEVSLSVNDVATYSVNADRLLPRSSVVVDIGDYNRKIRTIHAAEMAVQTLIAQDVISTVGGQIVVAPTSQLIADISSTSTGSGTDVLYTNLVAYWSLDEVSGTRLDSKGTNHLSDRNTVMSTTGKVSVSALFDKANSERLNIADNTALSVSDIDFYMACWIYPTLDDASTQVIASKGGASGDRAWVLQLNWAGANNRVEFIVYNSSNATTQVNSGALTVNSWYFVEAWHNAASNQIGVAVNTTETTAAHTTGVKNDTSNFTLGALNTGNNYTGRIDEFGFWKSYIPNGTRRTFLYNAGSGRNYTDIYNYGAGSFTIDLKHNNFGVDDFLYLSAAPGGIQQTEVFKITSGYTYIAGGFRYSAQRNLADTGPRNWYAGDAVTGLGGAIGEGYINLTATTTLHNHYGPTIAHYVRRGMGAWDSVAPVVASGNLRSFVDYTGDEFGHAAGNDLLLAPSEGFRGYTIDTVNGMRTFNVDIALYEEDVEFLNIGTISGIDIETNDVATNDNRSISFNRSGQERAYIKAYEDTLVNTLRLVTTSTAGLDTATLVAAFAPTAKIATATLQASQFSTGASSVVCYQPATAGSAYVSIASTGSISLTATSINTSGLLSMSGDIDLNGNDIIDIGTLGETWTTLSFNTGWGNFGGGFNAMKYKKAGDFVYLRGLVLRSSGSSATIATLPSGYRPAAEHVFAVSSGTAFGEVRITTAGVINLQSGAATTWVSLDGIAFSTLA